MHCRYCGHQIRWSEVGGWLIVIAGETVSWSSDCPSRPNPKNGHALPEEEEKS